MTSTQHRVPATPPATPPRHPAAAGTPAPPPARPAGHEHPPEYPPTGHGGPVPEEEGRVRALETEVAQLRTAMANRAPIEQAKGVLMLLTGCGEQGAFDLLAHISSHTHRKVREVALDLVASATGQQPLSAEVRGILRDACPPAAAR